jgi:hypothetical protein
MSKTKHPKTVLQAAHELIERARKLAPDGDGETMLAYTFAVAIAELAWPKPIETDNTARLFEGVMRATAMHWCDLHGIDPDGPVGHA